jgi:hypothetical protein
MSKKYAISKVDLKKVGTGLVIALLGSLATYMEQTCSQIDFGSWTIFIVALNSTLVNLIRKWIADETKELLKKCLKNNKAKNKKVKKNKKETISC